MSQGFSSDYFVLFTYLLKLHDVWVHQESMVKNFSLHIFRHLQATRKLLSSKATCQAHNARPKGEVQLG